jgi:hypothetical protein
MMKRLLAASAAGLSLYAAAGIAMASGEPVTRFVNAAWWEDGRFVTGERYVRGEVFVKKTRADRTVDLQGAFVTPPFGEAHNHNLDAAPMALRVSDQYLANGVFYVKIPNSRAELTPATRALLNKPDTVDAIFSMGGITAPGGHPIKLYGFLSRFTGQPREGETFEGDAFHVVRTESDIAPILDKLQSQGADFVKTYVLYSEDYATRQDSKSAEGHRGLDPAIYPAVVKAAHARGLRVSVHIETVHDFRVAVAAGVDEINHLPGYGWAKGKTEADYRITDADAKAAAKAGVVVVSTTVVTDMVEKDPARRKAIEALQAANLQTLASAGVELAIGSDTYLRTSRVEADNLIRIGAFDGATVLKLWIETPRVSIFPNRRISCLKVGCEADFLALGADPLKDFSATADIRQAWKDGAQLTLPTRKAGVLD